MKFVSLFSGIGGLDEGLENVGMVCVAQVENAEFPLRILKILWPDIPRFGDVRKVNGYQLPQANGVVAGFPCPKFSSAGKRGGFEEDNLFYEIIRIANEIKSDWIIIENVEGFTHSTKPWREIAIGALKDIGYDIIDFILDARDFGVPQSRRRWFAVCIRRGIMSSPQHIWGVQGEEGKDIQGLCAYSSYPKGRWTSTIGSKEEWRTILANSRRVQVDNGIPPKISRGFKAAYGNAVPPIMAEFVGRIVMKAMTVNRI